MSVCMVILVVIQDQLSYDEIHTKKERIYRIQHVDSLSSMSINLASTPYALGPELQDNYAIAEELVILNSTFRGEGLYNDTRLDINGMYTNSDFFDVFDFELQDGSAAGILDEPYSIVLSSETAKKFFGDEDPIGKFIEMDTLGTYERYLSK